MYILASMWFDTLMRNFFFNIDKVVYNFISSLYDLLIAIARTSVLTQADIAGMADRVYKLLTVFMVFKVTLSLITYVVNPDEFSDKSKGISKLGTNIIISLALLILTPYIFNYAYELQTIILEDNSLATLIFGQKSDDEFLTTAGDDMAFMTMSAFFTPNVSISELYDCTQLMVKNNDGKKSFNSKCSGLNEDLEDLGNANSLMGLTNKKHFSPESLYNYVSGIEAGSLPLMFRKDIATAADKENKNFIIDYKYLFSTVVGVVVVLLLITFCMDVGLRSIKLSFLQLIAPIPILSYIDPKSGKDGLFKKWYEMCFKTFLSLFVRLLALYFGVYIISKVADLKMVDIVDGSYVTNGYIAIFIIIGALMFAKQLPKMLEGLGIKLDGGGFTLNPLRKIEKEALGGKILKKPNDSLVKFAKGGFGTGTLAKKTLSGMNAAYHGKGFKNGFDRYKGGFGKWVDKQREAYLPYGYEASKKKKEGKENLAMRNKYDTTGSKYFNPKTKKMDKDSFLEDLGKINQNYRRSFEDVDKKKVNMYEAQAKADAYKNLIHDGKLNQKQREKLAKELGIKETSDNALIQGLNKFSGAAEKQYETAKAKHDEHKKISPKAAKLEDAYDYYDKMNSGASEISDAPVVSMPGSLSNPNTGSPNTGSPNTGSPNTKSPNTGSPNTGSPNTGSPNTGSSNTGSPNTGSSNTGSPNTGSSSMPETSSPAENINEQNKQDKEQRKQQIEIEIEKLNRKMREQEESINKNIKKSEELIALYEQSIYNEKDNNMKSYYRGLAEAEKDKVTAWKKDLEDFKDDTQKVIETLKNEMEILSE